MSNAKNPVSGGSVTQDGGEEAPPVTPATTTAPLAWKVPGKADDVAAASANNPAADKVGTVTATPPEVPVEDKDKKPTDEVKVDTATSKPDEPVVDKKPSSGPTNVVVVALIVPRKVGDRPDVPVVDKKPASSETGPTTTKDVLPVAASGAQEAEGGTSKEKLFKGLLWGTFAAILLGLALFIGSQLNDRKSDVATATTPPPAPTALTAPSTTEWSKGGSQPSEY